MPSRLAIDLATARCVARQRRLLRSGQLSHAAKLAKSPQTLALDLDLTDDLARATTRLADSAAITLLTKAPVTTYVPKPVKTTLDSIAILDRAVQAADLTGISMEEAQNLIEQEIGKHWGVAPLLRMLKRNREFHSLVLYKGRLRLPHWIIVRRLAEMHVAAKFGGSSQNPTP